MSGPDLRSERMPIGGGFTVSFSFVAGKLDAEWHPRIPVGHKKGRRYFAAYQRARNEFVRRIARKTGVNIVVVDL